MDLTSRIKIINNVYKYISNKQDYLPITQGNSVLECYI